MDFTGCEGGSEPGIFRFYLPRNATDPIFLPLLPCVLFGMEKARSMRSATKEVSFHSKAVR